MKMSLDERKFFSNATTGGMEVEDAFRSVWTAKDKNVLVTNLKRKKKARPEIFEAINAYKADLFKSVKKAQEEALLTEAKGRILSALEKRDLLTQIMLGEINIAENVSYRGKIKSSTIKPTFMERLKAMDIDNKMAGDYLGNEEKENKQNVFLTMMQKAFTVDNPWIPNEINGYNPPPIPESEQTKNNK